MTLVRVISGGQTGVDQAALRAARRLGIATGGWAPHGYKTLRGCERELLAGFGLVEHESAAYPPRTEANVRDSDATLRIAADFSSPGERCTKSAIERLRKHCLNIHASHLGGGPRVLRQCEHLRNWLRHHNVQVLNVAGNSEETAPGIGALAEEFLLEALCF